MSKDALPVQNKSEIFSTGKLVGGAKARARWEPRKTTGNAFRKSINDTYLQYHTIDISEISVTRLMQNYHKHSIRMGGGWRDYLASMDDLKLKKHCYVVAADAAVGPP